MSLLATTVENVFLCRFNEEKQHLWDVNFSINYT